MPKMTVPLYNEIDRLRAEVLKLRLLAALQARLIALSGDIKLLGTDLEKYDGFNQT